MPVSAHLYPWDVDGDPAAAERIAGLGVTEVSLAAAYHAVRAVTPFHPQQRIVTRDAAVYYRPDPGRWRDALLRPPEPDGDAAGSFERAADALHAAGLRVNAWIVVAHNGRLAAAHPDCAVRNAYGDVYPWALCIGCPEVAGYAATLAAEIAALDGVDEVELEACGWYGFDHGGAHDKAGGPPAGAPGWLLDACFCAACAGALRDAGVDPGAAARRIRVALDAAYEGGGFRPAHVGARRGTGRAGRGGQHGPRRCRRGLPAPRAGRRAGRRARPGRARPRRSRSARGRRQPRLRSGGAPGPGRRRRHDRGLPGPVTHAEEIVRRTKGKVRSGRRIAATLPAVAALGAITGDLPSKARAVLAAGATDLRLYHAGLASAADLTAMREATKVSVG